jgi:hypothetical protein
MSNYYDEDGNWVSDWDLGVDDAIRDEEVRNRTHNNSGSSGNGIGVFGLIIGLIPFLAIVSLVLYLLIIWVPPLGWLLLLVAIFVTYGLVSDLIKGWYNEKNAPPPQPPTPYEIAQSIANREASLYESLLPDKNDDGEYYHPYADTLKKIAYYSNPKNYQAIFEAKVIEEKTAYVKQALKQQLIEQARAGQATTKIEKTLTSLDRATPKRIEKLFTELNLHKIHTFLTWQEPEATLAPSIRQEDWGDRLSAHIMPKKSKRPIRDEEYKDDSI